MLLSVLKCNADNITAVYVDFVAIFGDEMGQIGTFHCWLNVVLSDMVVLYLQPFAR